MDICYPMLWVNTNRGDKIPFHGPKHTKDAMITLQTRMGHWFCLLYPQAILFVVTSILMQMVIARGLFSGLPSEDPHAHIAKVRAVCKSCVGRPDLDLDVIGIRVFPLSLMGEAAIWFTELPYNSIFLSH